MGFKFKNAVYPLIGINLVMFFLQIMFEGFTESFMLVSSDIYSRPWILLTSMFLHGGFSHLLFNMYALLMFGNLIEQRIGTKRFLFIYFVSSWDVPSNLKFAGGSCFNLLTKSLVTATSFVASAEDIHSRRILSSSIP